MISDIHSPSWQNWIRGEHILSHNAIWEYASPKPGNQNGLILSDLPLASRWAFGRYACEQQSKNTVDEMNSDCSNSDDTMDMLAAITIDDQKADEECCAHATSASDSLFEIFVLIIRTS
jgi:hypothetical protein